MWREGKRGREGRGVEESIDIHPPPCVCALYPDGLIIYSLLAEDNGFATPYLIGCS